MFIANILDLTDDRRLHDVQKKVAEPDISAEELHDAYHMVHTIYVQTHPRSDLSEPELNDTAKALQREIKAQYAIISAFQKS